MKRKYFPLSVLVSIVLVVPVSPNYALRELEFGGSGGVGQTENYNYEGVIGSNGMPMNGTAYNGGLGFGFTQMANVPNAPTVTNPDNYYDKLHLVIDPSGNPNDTLFAIAISSDNFVTTQYVKADHAIGNTLTFNDYLDYSQWGAASGIDILGLEPAVTYSVKVKAMQGDFTESGWGPLATAATIGASLTFDIDLAPTDTPTSPPYNLAIGTLLAGSVSTGSDKIWVTLETNGQAGADVFIASANGGLHSDASSYTINSATGDLDVLAEGYGLRGSSVSQSEGGPLTIASPFNANNNQVGQISTTFQKIFQASAPITNGRGSAELKAKASSGTPAGSDFTDILTVIAAVSY